jgi:hypothetical protein
VGWWIPLTLLGWIVFWELELSGLLSRALGQNSGIAFVSDTVHLAVFGIALGGFQWLVLRGKVQADGWWVVASLVGAVLGALFADAINYGLASDSPLGFLTGSVVWAAATGLCMTWLLSRNQALD